MIDLKNAFLSIILCFWLSACVTYEDSSRLNSNNFPDKPDLMIYSKPPIIQRQQDNFVVTDEFLENSILLKKYADRIDEWKATNLLK